MSLALSLPADVWAQNLRVQRRVALVQLANGVLKDEQGAAVHLDGVNYKDQLDWYLYEQDKTPDWSHISQDFSSMASMGAKVIRVWFNWINYERSPGTLDQQRMLSDMQMIVGIAKQNHLYVIITIFTYNVHFGMTYKVTALNWVQADATSSKTDPNAPDFWLNDGDSPARQRDLFIGLWLTISSHFKNEPTVAMYDLLNEPYNKYYDVLPAWAESDPAHDDHYPLKTLYDQVTSSVRNNGDGHLIMLDYEWSDGFVTFPTVKASSDPQVLYDLHLYYTARETLAQGWDQTGRNYGPWSGKAPDGTPVSYNYPDPSSGHDVNALRSRIEPLTTIKGYVFYLGEFGFTENTAYNANVANLVVELDLPGFAYFEYMPSYAEHPDWSAGPVGSYNVTQLALAAASP